MAKFDDDVRKGGLIELFSVAECQIFRWLLSLEQKIVLDAMSFKAHALVLKSVRTPDKGATASSAMALMMTTAASKKKELQDKKAESKMTPVKSSKAIGAKSVHAKERLVLH